jgi:hypothetical protein
MRKERIDLEKLFVLRKELWAKKKRERQPINFW